jgi:hypothetical protein
MIVLVNFSNDLNDALAYLEKAKSIYRRLRQKYSYSIAIIECSIHEAKDENDLLYKVTINVYELERGK